MCRNRLRDATENHRRKGRQPASEKAIRYPDRQSTDSDPLKGFGDIAVGNIVGSNIYNLAFILGVVSLIRIIPITRTEPVL